MCLGLPGKVIEVRAFDGLGLVEGKVEFGSIVKEVNLSFTPEVKVGDYVVVHVGFSISTIDEEEARRTLETLEAYGELSEFGETGERGGAIPGGSVSDDGEGA